MNIPHPNYCAHSKIAIEEIKQDTGKELSVADQPGRGMEVA
jgi:hypothetical protein